MTEEGYNDEKRHGLRVKPAMTEEEVAMTKEE
jgi:hypothetical protein